MVRRTTILLDDEIYEYLVSESIKKYGSSKRISQLVNELLRRTMFDREKVVQLLMKEKVARTTAKEFESFRRDLSRRAEG
jgi:hypothetical protein